MSHIAMAGIRKWFASSGTLANDEAVLEVASGTIHALVGENGAGKSTLMRVLYGLERADSGSVKVDGREARIASPREAARLGIGMVQQHFAIVDEFTVAENMVLGAEPRRGGFLLDSRRARAAVAATLERHGIPLDPDRPARSLSVGERQRLEIARLLHRDADTLILDEPTSVLAGREIEELFDSLRALRDSGRTVIVITHKVREVMALSDEVTVMRGGRTVARLRTQDTDEYGLSCMIMGTSSCPDFSRSPARPAAGDPVIEARDLRAGGAGGTGKRGGAAVPGLDGVNLSVRSGEVLGICAISGNGTKELEDVFSGFLPPASGGAFLHGKPVRALRTPPGQASGLGYVPSERMRRGAALSMDVTDNLIAADRKSFHPRGMRSARRVSAAAVSAIARSGIRAAPGQPVGALSGGTVQKLILARELAEPASAALLLAEPTWGLDIAATNEAYERILAARDTGSAILLISSNLDEILGLSDRIAVLYRGRLVHAWPNDGTATRELIGDYMLGARS